MLQVAGAFGDEVEFGENEMDGIRRAKSRRCSWR